MNDFLYIILNDYANLNEIIEQCGNFLCIKNNKISGNYNLLETKINFELNIKSNEINGYIKKNDEVEVLLSKLENNKYISLYKKQFKSSESIKQKNIITIYDINKKLVKREKIIEEEYFSNGKPISDLCYKQCNKIYLINNILLQKEETLYKYNPLKNKTSYSYSTDYKQGVFASETENPHEYYVGFQKIDKKKYKKLSKI